MIRLTTTSRTFTRSFTKSARNVAFAFDIDGVLLRGSQVIPQAPKALNLLNDKKVPWILLTNGGGKSEAERVEELSQKLGVKISERQFIQSHTPFQQLTKKYNRVLVVGGDGDKVRHVSYKYGFKDVVMTTDVIKQAGKSISPFHRYQPHELEQWTDPGVDVFSAPFDAVLVFNDPRDMSTDLQIIMDLLLSESGQLGTKRHSHSSIPAIPIHFSNNDLLWANNYKLPRFGQGAFRICVERLYQEMTGHKLQRTIIGKPFSATYEFADQVLHEWSPGANLQTAMVGDNEMSDIHGANDYGWTSMLVRTGVYQDSDNLTHKPDFIFDNVLDAVEFGIEQKL